MKRVTLLLLLLVSQLAHSQTKAGQKLFTAIVKNNLTLAQNAINEGADPNGSEALIKAVELNRPDIVNLLLSHHANVNIRRQKDLFSPLMVAAEIDSPEVARALISSGADVNLSSRHQQTALHVSAARNSTSVAKVLLSSRELDVNANSKLCALAVAARAGHVGLVILLKKQTGSKASSPICLEKALELAQKQKHEQVISILSRP